MHPAFPNVPATVQEALASNCVLPSAVPRAIGAGVGHVTVGVAGVTVSKPAAYLIA